MTRVRRFAAIALFSIAAAAALGDGACKKKPAQAQHPPGFERRPYTPIPPPPTRTLKPGEPTPLPKLPE